MHDAARTPLLMLACMLLAACDASEPPEPAAPAPASTLSNAPPSADHQEAIRVSEQRVDQLMDIARSLRDADANLAWPVADAFWAEVRRRHPSGDPRADATLDGWQRPLLYAREGDMRKVRLYSAGPNGKDEYGHVDDVALREGETLIE